MCSATRCAGRRTISATKLEWLYRPWRMSGAGSDVACFFRDDRLSDLIGFEYCRWHGRTRPTHFVGELEAIARSAQEGEVPIVSVILDGENAWEFYPYNGYYFLTELYGRLETHPFIRTTTFGEWLEETQRRSATRGDWASSPASPPGAGSTATWPRGSERRRRTTRGICSRRPSRATTS